MFVRHFNVEQNNNLASSAYENDQVEFFILLCAKQKVILTSNLRLATSLVYGLIGKIVSLFYKENLAPSQLPTFGVVNFYRYVGPPWDPNNPTYLPIPLIKRGDRTYIPLKMGWALKIRKSQRMTLPKATIEIVLIEI